MPTLPQVLNMIENEQQREKAMFNTRVAQEFFNVHALKVKEEEERQKKLDRETFRQTIKTNQGSQTFSTTGRGRSMVAETIDKTTNPTTKERILQSGGGIYKYDFDTNKLETIKEPEKKPEGITKQEFTLWNNAIKNKDKAKSKIAKIDSEGDKILLALKGKGNYLTINGKEVKRKDAEMMLENLSKQKKKLTDEITKYDETINKYFSEEQSVTQPSDSKQTGTINYQNLWN